MHRYIGILWDASNPSAARTAARMAAMLVRSHADWDSCCGAPGMLVFAPDLGEGFGRILTLPSDHGVVLGRLFPANSDHWQPGWEPSFTEALASEAARTGGRLLLDEFWGAYIAFLFDASSGASYVVRDSSGTIPCYATSHGGTSIVFGDLADLDGLGLLQFSVDLEYLSAFIYSPELQVNRCAVHGVTEVLAGQRLQHMNGMDSISNLWDPCEVVRRGFIDSAAEARAALRSTTEFCIATHASTFSNVVHSLSGGLDSAIVLGCLSRIADRPRVTCVNRFHAAPGEDERIYAKRAADKAGFELLEHPWCSTNRMFDESILAFPKTPKPYIPLPFWLLDVDSWNEIARRHGAQAVWTGEGGDHIFFNVPTSLGAADYIQTHRLFSRGTAYAVIDAARYSQEPYLDVLRSSLRLARSRERWTSHIVALRTNGKAVPFLRHEALPTDVDEFIKHPWLLHRDDLPKGKQLQIELLLELLNRHRFTHASAPEHHPLISQPLLELSLRIPLSLLTIGGRQRGLARQAFHDVVPPDILAREDKGSTSIFWIRKIRESQPFVRDLLLGGWLAAQGLIDRKSLEPYLVAGQPIRPEQWDPLAACIAAEMWARSWNTG